MLNKGFFFEQEERAFGDTPFARAFFTITISPFFVALNNSSSIAKEDISILKFERKKS